MWPSAFRPGTELAFAEDIECERGGLLFWRRKLIKHKTATFRQVNQVDPSVYHDALEFPDGQAVLLTYLCEGQQAAVLQFPVEARAATPEPCRPAPALACDVTSSTVGHPSGHPQQGGHRIKVRSGTVAAPFLGDGSLYRLPASPSTARSAGCVSRRDFARDPMCSWCPRCPSAAPQVVQSENGLRIG